MIDLPFAKSKTYAMFALGVTGIATARALIASGAKVVAWDDKQDARANAAGENITLADLHASDLTGIDALILSPGIPHSFPAPHAIVKRFTDAGIPFFTDIELLVQAQPGARFVGITGTNGKSTTTALTSHILSENSVKNAVGGNLGQAVMTLPAMGADGIYVLELSSYQLELIPSLVCDVAVLLNVTPDHLERHGGMEGYVAAKRLIFRKGDKKQTFVIGIDDTHSAEIAAGEGAHATPLRIGSKLDRGVSVADGTLYENGTAIDRVDNIVALPGAHNAQNIAAAFAATRALGLEPAMIMAAIRNFPGLSHRQEIVDTYDDVTFINDSKATNVDAAAKALVCYNPIYWIAGGKPKEGGFDGLNDYLGNVKHAFLIGEAAPAMADWLTTRNVPFSNTETLQRAVQAAAHMAWQDDIDGATVLLSPACASFDQFPNFEARGDLFRDAVRALKVEAAG